jgi:hypothetical protein
MTHKPDNLEKGIRFGCGSIFGLLLGVYVSAKIYIRTGNTLFSIGIGLLIPLILGFTAMKQGDNFWDSLKDFRFW